MARLAYEEAQNMITRSSSDYEFLSLKDKEKLHVRFLAKDPDDVDIYSVHFIELNGKRRSVSCIRQPNEDVSTCPLCTIGNRPTARCYIFMVPEDDHSRLLLWDRPMSYLDILVGKYKEFGTLCDNVFEIERIGAIGDTKTRYNILHVANSAATNMPEKPEVFGSLILNKNAAELDEYIATKSFPSVEKVKQDATPLPKRTVASEYVPVSAPMATAPVSKYTRQEVQPIKTEVTSYGNYTPSKKWGRN